MKIADRFFTSLFLLLIGFCVLYFWFYFHKKVIFTIFCLRQEIQKKTIMALHHVPGDLGARIRPFLFVAGATKCNYMNMI